VVLPHKINFRGKRKNILDFARDCWYNSTVVAARPGGCHPYSI